MRESAEGSTTLTERQIEDAFVHVLSLEETEQTSYLSGLEASEPDLWAEVCQLLKDFGGFEALLEGHSSQIHDGLSGAVTITGAGGLSREVPSAAMLEKVGPYRILKKIGQGGMGVVYLAEQDTPRRKVAVKLIPKAQVSANFLARFEGEYQALALMNHHHIARIYDADSTSEGNAYFVMEYIDGISIVDYCASKPMTIREKLELFMQGCAGVQHAHQKAIIHRDLKPSNILVYEDHGKPIAKIIDFGMAKELEGSDTLLTPKTVAGGLSGTPAYMSPEQLTGHNERVDTRGDIYAMGVILYELLAGTHPHDLKALRDLPLDEALRTLRLGSVVAPSRRCLLTEKPSLDLDHLVLKAMAKEASERYASIDALSDDIHNVLEDRPVSALSRNRLHVFWKFFGRNKTFISLTMVAVTGLILGLALAISSSIKANKARSESQAALNFLKEAFLSPSPRQSGRHTKLIDYLEGAEQRLAEGALANERLSGDLRLALGNTWFSLGQYVEAERVLIAGIKDLMDAYGPNHRETLQARYLLGRVLVRNRRYSEAMPIYTDIWNKQKRSLGPGHPETLRTLAALASLERLMRDFESAETHFREALTGQREVLGEKHEDTLWSLVGLANTFSLKGDLDAALHHYTEAFRLQSESLGADDPLTMFTHNSYAKCLFRMKRYEAAARELRPLIENRERVLGADNIETLDTKFLYCRVLMALSNYETVAEQLPYIISRRRLEEGENSRRAIQAMVLYGESLLKLGQFEEVIGITEAVLARPSDEAFYQRSVHEAVLQASGACNALGAYDQSLAFLERRLAWPSENDDLGERLEILYAMMSTYWDMGDFNQVERIICEAVELGHQLRSDHPGFKPFREGWAILDQWYESSEE